MGSDLSNSIFNNIIHWKDYWSQIFVSLKLPFAVNLWISKLITTNINATTWFISYFNFVKWNVEISTLLLYQTDNLEI